MKICVGVVVCAIAFAARAQAQESGSELRVFLLTLGPGTLIYERFGHNTICIHDPNPSAEVLDKRAVFEAKIGGRLKPAPPFNRTDRAYHYGAFDFEQENFIWRFIHGRMQYWLAADWADWTVLAYAADNRTVLLQELNLTPRQKRELKAFLEDNERPENRFYRYDYYRDNCSTRVRDAIDRATGFELGRLHAVPTGTTYRSHTRRLTSGVDPLDLFWFTAFTYVLGHPVDEPLSAWEECFLPEKLAEHLRRITVGGTPGGEPLVLSEQLLSSSTRRPLPAADPHRTPQYAVAGLLVGGAFAALARAGRRGRPRWGRVARWTLAVVLVPWATLWGLGGAIGTYGWLVTDHTASYRNENLLQFTPLLLGLAVLGPALALRRGGRRVANVAVVLAVAGAGLSVLGWILQILPWFWQHNGEIIALALPANVGLAVAVVLLARDVSQTLPTQAAAAANIKAKS